MPAPELREDVRRAYADNLVDPSFARLTGIERDLGPRPQGRRERHYVITDAIAEMEWWDSFDPEEQGSMKLPEPQRPRRCPPRHRPPVTWTRGPLSESRRLAATIHARTAAARNTKSVVGRAEVLGFVTSECQMKRPTLKHLRPKRQPEQHHNVYVVLLDLAAGKIRKVRADNPKRDPQKPCVYVGMTGLTPEERFANHQAGIKDASLVKRYGIRLLPELYAHLNPIPFEAAAQMEVDLAEDLRRAGYTVTGGH